MLSEAQAKLAKELELDVEFLTRPGGAVWDTGVPVELFTNSENPKPLENIYWWLKAPGRGCDYRLNCCRIRTDKPQVVKVPRVTPGWPEKDAKDFLQSLREVGFNFTASKPFNMGNEVVVAIQFTEEKGDEEARRYSPLQDSSSTT